jgi:DNA-binding CsgD family transcriptional regulator
VVSPVLRRVAFVGSAQATTLLVVTDPARCKATALDLLQQRYGLTRMEARVASCFMSGADTNGIAEQLSISIHTARTHLKRILAKTNTSRQAELMRILLTELT